MKKINEMERLEALLNDHYIPHETLPNLLGNPQIWYPSSEKPVCDVICHEDSYGGTNGLLEIRGLVDDPEDDVEGYLTAAEIFDRILTHYWMEKEN